jgi:hypothetical protein
MEFYKNRSLVAGDGVARQQGGQLLAVPHRVLDRVDEVEGHLPQDLGVARAQVVDEPGTHVMVLKISSPKSLAKRMTFYTKYFYIVYTK